MTRSIEARASWIVEQRRVACDCGRTGRHADDCRLEVAWSRAIRQAESQVRREAEARRQAFAVAV